LLPWSDYNASAALVKLLDEGLVVRSAQQPFVSSTQAGDVEFGYGSVIVNVAEQKDFSSTDLNTIINETAREFNLTFYTANTGLSQEGIDLGSRHSQVVDKPEAAIVFGDGVRSTEAGEAWFLLNRHLELPITKIDSDVLPRADLGRYNTLVLVDGNYGRWSEDTVEEIKRWVRNGGSLITSGRATRWAIVQEIVSEDFRAEDPELVAEGARFNYEERDDRRRANTIPGVILEADIDPSHPIAFGVDDRSQLFIKQSSNFLKQGKNPYGTVAKFTEDPLVAGFVNDKNLERIRGTAAILVSEEGSGNVILFSENPNFRSYWHTTSRLFINAILFGRNI
ncbi:MAG: peptidase M14, partial [Bacteroidota bacterium]